MMFSWRLIPMSVLFMQLFFFDVAYSTKDCQNYFYFSYFLIYHIGTSIKWTKSKSHFISFTNSLLNTNIFPLFFVFLISCLANSNCSLLLLLSRFSRVQLCDPIDGSPPGSPVPGILQARTLEWVVISFSNAGKGKVKVKSLSRVRLFTTPWSAAYQAPLSMGFSRQEY